MSANPLTTIDQFITEVSGAEKAAAEAHTEPGSIGGETSHPVKNVDDRTSEATEGERSSENSADVKKDQGEPAVDNAPEAQAKVAMNEGTAADDQLQIGTNKQPTGDDPQNETSSAKPGKEDGGYEGPSSHPARTDNDDLDGHKYAGDIASMSLEEKAAALAELGNEICAAVAVAGEQPAPKQAEEACDEEEEDDAEYKAAAEQLAGQVGWEMAGILTGSMDKQAADAMVQNALVDIVKSAEADADNVAAYLKLAMEGEEGGEEASPKAEADGEESAESSAPAPDAEEAPEAGGDPAGLDAALAPAPEAGGEGNGMDELAAVLEELGVTPDELLAMIEGEGEAGAPPAPEAGLEAGPEAGLEAAPPVGPEAGGMPPVDPAAMGGMEVAASDKGEAAADKTASYIKEVVQRARAKRAEAAK